MYIYILTSSCVGLVPWLACWRAKHVQLVVVICEVICLGAQIVDKPCAQSSIARMVRHVSCPGTSRYVTGGATIVYNSIKQRDIPVPCISWVVAIVVQNVTSWLSCVQNCAICRNSITNSGSLSPVPCLILLHFGQYFLVNSVVTGLLRLCHLYMTKGTLKSQPRRSCARGRSRDSGSSSGSSSVPWSSCSGVTGSTSCPILSFLLSMEIPRVGFFLAFSFLVTTSSLVTVASCAKLLLVSIGAIIFYWRAGDSHCPSA